MYITQAKIRNEQMAAFIEVIENDDNTKNDEENWKSQANIRNCQMAAGIEDY